MKTIRTPQAIISIILSLACHADANSGGTNLAGVTSDDPKVLAGRVMDHLLSQKHMYYGDRGMHYAEACAALGAIRVARENNDKVRLDALVARYGKMLTPGNPLISQHRHVDQSVVGIVPLQIFLATGDKRHLELGLSLADRQWENPTEDGLTPETRWWIDDMYMVGMLQIQAYRATKEAKYADRAAIQLVAYLDKLQQDHGLFFHGPEFHYLWGRGNGWVAVSLAEVLASLPEDHKLRPRILNGYKRMMASLLSYQTENGMWRQLVDYPYSWEESSATAMFAYAMSVGVKHGLLDASAYESAVQKALKALCAHVDRKGRLREVCIGTGQEDDVEFYLNRPRALGDFHGQAPFLWLVAETEKPK